MTERIYAPSVLETTSGNLSINVTVPEKYDVPLNPDGTAPQITIAVAAETLGLAVTAIRSLRDQQDMLTNSIFVTALDRVMEGDLVEYVPEYADLYHTIVTGDKDFDDDSPVFQQFGQWVQQYTGWETTGIEITLSTENTHHEVEFTITAPGYVAAMSAMRYITQHQHVVNGIIANAMPTVDEYDDYYDEDY